MRTLIIKAKMSGTGSIHDIASCVDREIDFPKGAKYAVILADFYGGRGYSTHRSEAAVIREAGKLQGYSLDILDARGNSYIIELDRLIAK